MFDISPVNLLILAVAGLLIFGPERLPGMARDGARAIRTARELLAGARTQLDAELGPEFGNMTNDLDLRRALAKLLDEPADTAPTVESSPSRLEAGVRALAQADARSVPALDRPRPRPYPRSAA